MTKIKTIIFFFFVIPSLLLAQPKVYIKIGEPEFKKPVLAYDIKCGMDTCDDIKELSDIFASDMNSSNVLILLSKKMYPSEDKLVDLNAWKVSGAEYLVMMEVQRRGIQAKLIALRTGEEVFSEKFSNEDSIIDTTHSISNQVYYKLTGQKGDIQDQDRFHRKKGKRRKQEPVYYGLRWQTH